MKTDFVIIFALFVSAILFFLLLSFYKEYKKEISRKEFSEEEPKKTETLEETEKITNTCEYNFRIINPSYEGRVVFLDCETTGLDEKNDRIIELAMVEVVCGKETGKKFHSYFRVRKKISDGAYRTHGLTLEFLSDKPTFRKRSDEIVDFLRGAVVVAYNAPFDVGFLNNELRRVNANLSIANLGCEVVCAMRLAEAHYNKWTKFDVLANAYHFDIYGLRGESGHHSAKIEADLLPGVYDVICRIFERRERSLFFPITQKLNLDTGERIDEVSIPYRNHTREDFVFLIQKIHLMDDIEAMKAITDGLADDDIQNILNTYPFCRDVILTRYMTVIKTVLSMKTWAMTYRKDIA